MAYNPNRPGGEEERLRIAEGGGIGGQSAPGAQTGSRFVNLSKYLALNRQGADRMAGQLGNTLNAGVDKTKQEIDASAGNLNKDPNWSNDPNRYPGEQEVTGMVAQGAQNQINNVNGQFSAANSLGGIKTQLRPGARSSDAFLAQQAGGKQIGAARKRFQGLNNYLNNAGKGLWVSRIMT
jgi:hypothetical protein